jgi:hypothetical protein
LSNVIDSIGNSSHSDNVAMSPRQNVGHG